MAIVYLTNPLAGRELAGMKMRMGYWGQVRERAWREAIKAAWGDPFAAVKTVAIPVFGAVIAWFWTGNFDGSAPVRILASIGGGAVLSLVFFGIKMLTIPAKMHAESLERIASLEATKVSTPEAIDRSSVQNLLARMREKCLAYRSKKGGPGLEKQYEWADQLVADIGALYGPEVVLNLKRVLPNLTSRTLDSLEMDGHMRAMVGNLDKLKGDVKDGIFSNETPDLNTYVRRRLAELRAEQASHAP